MSLKFTNTKVFCVHPDDQTTLKFLGFIISSAGVADRVLNFEQVQKFAENNDMRS